MLVFRKVTLPLCDIFAQFFIKVQQVFLLSIKLKHLSEYIQCCDDTMDIIKNLQLQYIIHQQSVQQSKKKQKKKT